MASNHKKKMSKIIDYLLDFPYRKLFGVWGILVISLAVIVIFIIKFIIGIDSVAINPKNCKLSVWDSPYLVFHQDRILKNTSSSLRNALMENQRILRHIDDGVNPFKSSTDGNITRARKINNKKFVWTNMIKNKRRENLSIIKCLGKLRAYKF